MQIRGNFSDFFFETALPAMNAITWRKFRQKPMMYRKLFNIESSDRSIEQFSEVSGVGLFTEINEAGEVRIDQPVQGFDSTFRHKTYGLGTEASRELIEDDKIGLISQGASELGQSANESIEIDAATTFNNAFTAGATAGPDGVALCSASHPLVKYGGNQSNILSVAADLDITSLELALTDWETMRRSNGHQMSLPSPRLLVAPFNRWNAHEMLKGSWRSDTANRTVNAFKYAENGPVDEILVWPKLTDSDAWFLVASPENTGLVWIWRKKPYTRGFADDRTERGGTLMKYRKSHGFRDYVGVYGTPGA